MSSTANETNSAAKANIQEPEEVTIPVPWGHISGRWWGPREVQPVIALHGWQDNAGTWDTLAPLLTPQISLLAIDMMGHGLSSHYPKGQFYYLYWDGVSLIRRICRHYNWETITLLGHSLGGAIAFLYAASYPEMVDKLICIDIASPVLRPDVTFVHECGYLVEKFLDYEDILGKNLPSYKYEDAVNVVMRAYKDSLTRASCEILLKRGLTRVPDGSDGYYFSRDVRLKIAGLGNISRSTILEFASFVSCEVLNIKGIPGNIFDEEAFYYEVVEKMKSSLAKKVEFYEVEGMHHLHLNNPERIIPYISNFLICKSMDQVEYIK